MTANRALIAFLAVCALSAPARAVTARARRLVTVRALYARTPIRADDPNAEKVRFENEVLTRLNLQGLQPYVAALEAIPEGSRTDEQTQALETYRGHLERETEAMTALQEGLREDQRVTDVERTSTVNEDKSTTVTTTITLGDGSTQVRTRTYPANP